MLRPLRPTWIAPGTRPPPPPRELTIVTWNIAWGQGWGSDLSGVAPMRSARDRAAAIERVGALLAGADVALLQEVDVASKRSDGIDQARVIAERAGLPYVVSAPVWDVAYLPYPVWPPSAHAGRVRSGGAILSRLPLRDAWVETLPKPARGPAYKRPFWPVRYALGARLTLAGGVAATVVTTHLEAFDPENRRLQAGILASRAAALAASEPLVLAGDLNTVPPEAPMLHGFADEPETDFRGDRSYAIALGAFTPAIGGAQHAGAPVETSTFPSTAPTRMLDHLFVSERLRVVEARVLHEAGDSSDHLPLRARVAIAS